jgi:DNA-binding XRE family transcriptional regulator
MSFRKRLRRLRAEKDLTQAELAKVFGVAPTTIASWEQGRSRPEVTSKHYTRVFDASLKEAAMIYHNHLHGDGNN